MKIDRNNYEAYFLDYLEGNLDEKMVDDFIEFIRQNPDFKKELDLYTSLSLEPEEIVFDKKNRLFKEIYDTEEEFNRAAIAQMEGDLNPGEKIKFENYLSKNPKQQKEAALFSLTKLQPDKSVIFAKKNKLYRRTKGKVILLWASRVAAVLVLAVAIYIFIDRPFNDSPVSNEQIAVINDENETVEKVPEKIEDVEKKLTETSNTSEIKTDSVVKKDVETPKPINIRAEKTGEPVDNEQIAALRIPAEIPAKITTIYPTFKKQEIEIALIPMKMKIKNPLEDVSEDQFLADVVKEKTGLDDLSLNKITKAGLKLVSAISKEKFTYETDNSGKITEVNFDSRLLAFSIPTGNQDE